MLYLLVDLRENSVMNIIYTPGVLLFSGISVFQPEKKEVNLYWVGKKVFYHLLIILDVCCWNPHILW